jgi:protein-disulfide isomerase
MKPLLLMALVGLLVSCTTTTPTSPQKPIDTPTVQVSIQERLNTGIQYGSGQHTATLFADFQCPACIYFADTVLPILESYAGSGKLQITYKQFPLTSIHKNAYRDALAAFCADDQGKFMEYKKALYMLESQKSGASVSDEDRTTLARETGLDEARFASCLASETFKTQVDRDVADAEAIGVNATPTLFFDNKRLDFSAFGGDMQKIEQFFATRL